MNKFFSIKLLLIPFYFLISACHPSLTVTDNQYTSYKLSQTDIQDSVSLKMVQRYHDSLSAKMYLVIGVSENELTKGQPEGTLGNFCVDAMKGYVTDILYQQVDVSIVNSG